MFQSKIVEKIKTHTCSVLKLSSENHAVYELI